LKISFFEAHVPEFLQRICDSRDGFLRLFGHLGDVLEPGDFSVSLLGNDS
jgi:hypothetical protein